MSQTEWQALWNFINIVGWPSAILWGYFRNTWISKRQSDAQIAEIRQFYEDAILNRDKRFDMMNNLWKERLTERTQEASDWRDAFFGSVKIVERGVSAAEQVAAILPPKASD